MSNSSIKNVTRSINRKVENELWAKAAGRCQFDGCNTILFRSPITQESVNISEKAHIYSFSEKGPRGWGPLKKVQHDLNNISNLMLMCHGCHKTIDKDKEGVKYSANLLKQWKREHEERIEIVAAISSDKKSHVVFYGSNIGEQHSPLQKELAMAAMFPERYPESLNTIDLSMKALHEDKSPEYWKTEEANLEEIFERRVRSVIEESKTKHFSVFALSTIPLLIKLGSLFTDKIDVDTYQLFREPRGWKWQEFPDGFSFVIHKPEKINSNPVLKIAISDIINNDRINTVFGEGVTIWELTVPREFIGNDIIRNKAQLSLFRDAVRKLMIDIKEVHGNKTPLSIFPAMGIACSVEFGRVRMPKAEMPWVIYDQNYKEKKFINSITIGK